MLTQQKIENAQVSLFKRPTQKRGALLSLSSLTQSIFVQAQNTDAAGNFFLHIQALPSDYYALYVEYDQKQGRWISLIPANIAQVNLEIDLLPLTLSVAEEAILEAVNAEEKMALEIQKQNAQSLEMPSADITVIPSIDLQATKISQTCTFVVPTQVYVSNLVSGYNSTPTGTGFTGMIDFDEYVAGVVQKEIGGITSQTNALKAMAVAARTFSCRRHTLSLPVNVGQAYDFNPTATCIAAATGTTQEVLLYNNAVINANYAARCNGNFTQNSEQGRWGASTCGSLCATCGNSIAYLRSVICSGHGNCTQFTNESPCCQLTISSVNTMGNIYGHGVGMCQRGVQGFANPPFNWSYCDILTHFYTNICIANTSCTAGNSTFSLATMANPVASGTITGGGIYSTGSTSTLSAAANIGFTFANWTENGTVLGTNQTLNLTINSNRNIVANFTQGVDIQEHKPSILTVFPNPSEDGCFFVQTNRSYIYMTINDLLGRNVDFQSSVLADGLYVTLTQAEEGIYFIRLSEEAEKERVQKAILIKVKRP